MNETDRTRASLRTFKVLMFMNGHVTRRVLQAPTGSAMAEQVNAMRKQNAVILHAEEVCR